MLRASTDEMLVHLVFCVSGVGRRRADAQSGGRCFRPITQLLCLFLQAGSNESYSVVNLVYMQTMRCALRYITAQGRFMDGCLKTPSSTTQVELITLVLSCMTCHFTSEVCVCLMFQVEI